MGTKYNRSLYTTALIAVYHAPSFGQGRRGGERCTTSTGGEISYSDINKLKVQKIRQCRKRGHLLLCIKPLSMSENNLIISAVLLIRSASALHLSDYLHRPS